MIMVRRLRHQCWENYSYYRCEIKAEEKAYGRPSGSRYAWEVEDLVEKINNNFDSLFQRIRRADTLEYLKRLETVPQDVINLKEILLARELEPSDFHYLQKAYTKLVDIGKEAGGEDLFGHNYGSSYRLLLFQHFCGQSVEDSFLRDRMVADFGRLVSCCFDNDIRKSLSDVVPVLKKKDVAFDRVDVLKKLLSALKQSEFGKDADILNILKNGIADERLWEAATASTEESLEDETSASEEQVADVELEKPIAQSSPNSFPTSK